MPHGFGLFVPIYGSIARSPKIKRAADALGVDRITMIGHLVIFWNWAMEHAPDGRLDPFDYDDIGEAALWSGSGDRFVAALTHAGLIDTEPFAIHDWHEYGGKVVYKRTLDRERQQVHRDRVRRVETAPDDPPPTLQPCAYEKALGEDRMAKIIERFGKTNRMLDETWLRQTLRRINGEVGDRPVRDLASGIMAGHEAISRKLAVPPGAKGAVLSPKPFAATVLTTAIREAGK